jgi:hypothetical protein
MAQSRGFGGVCPDAPKRSVFSGYGDSLISLQFYPVIFRCAIERFGDKAHPNVYKTVVFETLKTNKEPANASLAGRWIGYANPIWSNNEKFTAFKRFSVFIEYPV